MIRQSRNLAAVKRAIQTCLRSKVDVTVNLGRNKVLSYRGELSGSAVFGKTMDLAATLAGEMANHPPVRKVVNLATAMSECFGGIKEEADGANEPGE